MFYCCMDGLNYSIAITTENESPNLLPMKIILDYPNKLLDA